MNLEHLYLQADRLSVDEKAELIKRLLNSSGLNVTFGNNQLSGSIVVQVNAMDKAAIADILEAIASRIAKEG